MEGHEAIQKWLGEHTPEGIVLKQVDMRALEAFLERNPDATLEEVMAELGIDLGGGE